VGAVVYARCWSRSVTSYSVLPAFELDLVRLPLDLLISLVILVGTLLVFRGLLVLRRRRGDILVSLFPRLAPWAGACLSG
jgi:hypothetical protein